MRKFGAVFAVLFLMCSLSTSLADSAPAEKKGAQPAAPAAERQPESKGADIMLLIDSSGSMRKTDPHDSRKTAAKLFISLLGSDDNVGVLSFGDTAKLLLPLTQNTGKNRDKLMSAVNKISSREFSTDIYAGVKTGFDELKASGRKKKVLLLLSDGKLTLGSKEKEAIANQNLSRLLPELAKSGISLSTIAFSDLADVQFLQDLAKAGGGFFKLALTEQDIHTIFATMFEKIKTPDTVPFDGDSFSIDKDIKEATVFVAKKAGTRTVLQEPSGTKNTPEKFGKNIKWYGTKLFDLITINEPATGRWKVNLSTKEGNRVFIITNLSLRSSFNSNFVNRNEKVKADVWLEKDGGVLKEKDVLDQVSLSADLTGPDGKPSKIALQPARGTSGDKTADGGVFTAEFVVPKTGDYALALMADGKTFKRTRTIQFKVVEPAPAPPQQAVQKSPPVAVAKKIPAPENMWGRGIIKFAILNGFVLLGAGVFYLVRKVKEGKNKTITKKKGGTPEA
ncbi:MAG: VWA domain-containing protein [Nitrospirae bacterium]|nr:VWA domain-containing protein [Nitrospirota bacterium]